MDDWIEHSPLDHPLLCQDSGLPARISQLTAALTQSLVLTKNDTKPTKIPKPKKSNQNQYKILQKKQKTKGIAVISTQQYGRRWCFFTFLYSPTHSKRNNHPFLCFKSKQRPIPVRIGHTFPICLPNLPLSVLKFRLISAGIWVKSEMGERSRRKGCCGWFLVLLVLVVIGLAVFITVRKRTQKSEPELGPVPGPPGAVQKKYGDALKIAMQFFDVQKCIIFSSPSISHFFVLSFRWISHRGIIAIPSVPNCSSWFTNPTFYE